MLQKMKPVEQIRNSFVCMLCSLDLCTIVALDSSANALIMNCY